MRYSLFAILLFTFSLIGAQSSVIPYGKNAKVGRYAEIRGIKMYYEIYGTGEPLLIIHGNGGSIADFNFQIPFFEKNYQVILADSRAQGKTVDDRDSLSYEMMADDLNSLLDVLKLDSCNVIGWSDGGINGLLLAMRHPEKVKKLAITGANLWPDSSAVDPYVYRITLAGYQDLLKQSPSPLQKRELKLHRLLCFEPNMTTAQLAAIKCPTLVMGGDHDVIRPEHTMLIAHAIPESYLWIVPNSGHAVPIFKSVAFNNNILEFFQNPYRKIDKEGRFQ